MPNPVTCCFQARRQFYTSQLSPCEAFSCRVFHPRVPPTWHSGICCQLKVQVPTACLLPSHRPALFPSDTTFPKTRVFRDACYGGFPPVLYYLPGPTVYDLSHLVSNTLIDLPYTLSGCPSYLTISRLWIIPQSTFSVLNSMLLRETGENPWKHSRRPPQIPGLRPHQDSLQPLTNI